MKECPCGSGATFERCCERFLSGREEPATATELLRARYTAHTCDRIDFVKHTHHPDTLSEFDEKGAQVWARESEWLGLEIVSTDGGEAGDDRGTIEFVARYRDAKGELCEHREVSLFEKAGGSWRFRDAGAPASREPYRRSQARVGRNDPCPCGSGKKHKKCCGRS